LQRNNFWKIPLILFIALFLITGCSAISDFMQDDIRGPSWDTNLRLPLIPTHEIKMVDLLNENDNEFDDEDIFSFEFELDKVDFGFDEIEVDDIDFGSIKTNLPPIKVDLGEVFNEEINLIIPETVQEVTLEESLNLSDSFSSIIIEEGSLEILLSTDPQDNELEFDIEIILLDNGTEISKGESNFQNGEAIVEITLDGEELPSNIDLEFNITDATKGYDGTLNYSLIMDTIKIEKVEDLEQEINISETITVNLDADEFDEHITKIVLEEGSLNLSPEFDFSDWNIDFSIENLSLDSQLLPQIGPGSFSLEGVVFDLEKDLEVKVDFRVQGNGISFDSTQDVGFMVSLTDFLWEKIKVSNLPTDVDEIVIEEEIIETGLEELKDWLEGIGLAEEAITLILNIENESEFKISSDLSFILLYNHEGTEEESEIKADDFTINPRETSEIRFTSGAIPSMPHSIKIPESSLSLSLPEGADEITISRSDYFSMLGSADFKLKFLVQPGGIKNDVATGELELETEDRDILDGWIQKVLIDFQNTNNLPLYLDITVFFSNDENNIFDPENLNWTIGLPETGSTENYLIEVSKEDVEIFKEPAWYGIRVEFLKDIEEEKEITFKYGDSFTTRANLDVEVRINPHED